MGSGECTDETCGFKVPSTRLGNTAVEAVAKRTFLSGCFVMLQLHLSTGKRNVVLKIFLSKHPALHD